MMPEMGRAKISAFSLRTQPGIPSGPVAFLGLKDDRLLKIWYSETWKVDVVLSSYKELGDRGSFSLR